MPFPVRLHRDRRIPEVEGRWSVPALPLPEPNAAAARGARLPEQPLDEPLQQPHARLVMASQTDELAQRARPAKPRGAIGSSWAVSDSIKEASRINPRVVTTSQN